MTATSGIGRSREDGFTLIDMLFVVGLIGMIFTLAIPGVMRARGAAHSASALGTIRVIHSAQLSYGITCGLGFYAPSFPVLGVKPAGARDGYLQAELATGLTFVRSGYLFSMAGTPIPSAPPTCNGLASGAAAGGYAMVADQLDATMAPRFFGSNADGVIYEHTSSLAATMPEAGAPPAGAAIR